MSETGKNPFRKLTGFKIFYPVIIGLVVVGFLLYKNYSPHVFANVRFSFSMLMFLILAVLFMGGRDIGYMYRIRILSDKKLTWIQSFRVIMLWEFTSALMPSAVGGTTFAMIYVNREGINFGRSTAIVMATSFLDELYFVIMFPLLLAIISIPKLFIIGTYVKGVDVYSLNKEFLLFAVIGYGLKFVYTLAIGYGLFVNPRGLKWLLLQVFRIPFLKKYRYKANITGDEIITSSKELKSKNFGFWLKGFAGTFFSWTSRYLVVNALFLAFFAVSDHFLLLARQLVMSNMMLVSPTPGASGFSEYFFTTYLGDFIKVSPAQAGSFGAVLAFAWRLISYFPYLIIGSIILPWWLKTKWGQQKEKVKS